MSSDWIRVALLLSEISPSMAWKKKKEASFTNVTLFTIVMSLRRYRSVLSIKDKNEDADDIVFQMICKIVVSRLNALH